MEETDKTTVKSRLSEYLKSKQISKSEFGRRIGVSSAFVSSMRTSIQPDKIKSIAIHFPDLNTDWLMTGEGSMLRPSVSQTAGDGSVNVANVNGNGNGRIGADPVALLSAHERLIDELAEQRKMFGSQIDRLLSLLERSDGK